MNQPAGRRVRRGRTGRGAAQVATTLDPGDPAENVCESLLTHREAERWHQPAASTNALPAVESLSTSEPRTAAQNLASTSASAASKEVYAPAQTEPPGDDADPAESAAFLGSMLEATAMDITAAYRARQAGHRREVDLHRGAPLTRNGSRPWRCCSSAWPTAG
jgi:hypothetical protein